MNKQRMLVEHKISFLFFFCFDSVKSILLTINCHEGHNEKKKKTKNKQKQRKLNKNLEQTIRRIYE